MDEQISEARISFPPPFPGFYLAEDVDAYVVEMQRIVEEAKARADRAERIMFGGVEKKVGRAIVAAQKSADAIVARAEEVAATIVAEAERRATVVLEKAHRDYEEILAQARHAPAEPAGIPSGPVAPEEPVPRKPAPKRTVGRSKRRHALRGEATPLDEVARPSSETGVGPFDAGFGHPLHARESVEVVVAPVEPAPPNQDAGFRPQNGSVRPTPSAPR